MALRENRGSREFDKFVADGSGDTATRVSVTSSVTVTADTSAGAVTLEGDTHTSSPGNTLMAATDISGKDRIGIQVWNNGASDGDAANRSLKVQVWASLKASPGSIAAPAWTQIGDTIDVDAQSSSYKAVSTTPIKYIAVTAYLDNASASIDTTADCYIMAD